MSTDLPCPNCQRALTSGALWPQGVLACGACGGLWLDPLNTDMLYLGLTTELLEVARSMENAPEPSSDSAGARRCARCQQPLVTALVESAGVRVDTCATHGTWFDAGELEQLASVIGATLRGEPRPASGGVTEDEEVARFARDVVRLPYRNHDRVSDLDTLVGELRALWRWVQSKRG